MLSVDAQFIREVDAAWEERYDQVFAEQARVNENYCGECDDAWAEHHAEREAELRVMQGEEWEFECEAAWALHAAARV